MASTTDSDFVRIFDTTLRDGEQSPGATMTLDEKLRIAKVLEALRVDAIEAGFPAASPGEVASVRAIASVVKNAEVVALCRTRQEDIDAAWSAIGEAAKPRLHVFIATSDLHLEHKLRMTREEVLAEIARGVAACRSLCDSVEFSAEDATRTDMGFLREAMACALEHGATVLNVPDTVGYALPDEYGRRIGEIVALAGDKAIVSAHCHDDLGLAVANSIAAIQAGARQVECCVNGIGERAGNAALEEVVMALRTREPYLGIASNVNTRHLVAASRLVSDVTGFSMQPNKAVVGRNAFAHESGIHQHGVLRERTTYEIMDPVDVGFAKTSLVLGKHSGRAALKSRLEELGYEVDRESLNGIFERFKALADRKKAIYDDDLRALFADSPIAEPAMRLVDAEFRSGMGAKPWAAATVEVEGQQVRREETGDGPVDALIRAIRACVGAEDVIVTDYALASVTEGADAQGRVFVTVSDGKKTNRGHATHTDVVIASGLALVDALNRHARATTWSPEPRDNEAAE
jgi:2-isopropylmalate synthase